MISTMIVDDSEKARNELRSALYADGEIEVIAEAQDGIDAEEKILTFMPQVVLVDLVMPRLDGIGLIRKIKNRHDVQMPVFIMISDAASEQAIKMAFDCGASYYYLRPFQSEEIIYTIKDTCLPAQHLVKYNDLLKKCSINCMNCEIDKKKEDRLKITKILQMYGIKSGIKGYYYLRRAIEIVNEKEDLSKLLTKEMYYDVAGEFNTTYASVERNIRYAIECGFKNQDASLPEQLRILQSGERRLKNLEFIKVVADYMKSYN